MRKIGWSWIVRRISMRAPSSRKHVFRDTLYRHFILRALRDRARGALPRVVLIISSCEPQVGYYLHTVSGAVADGLTKKPYSAIRLTAYRCDPPGNTLWGKY